MSGSLSWAYSLNLLFLILFVAGRDELRKVLKVNNISYHRHGDRTKNQMQTKEEMSLALCNLLESGTILSHEGCD